MEEREKCKHKNKKEVDYTCMKCIDCGEIVYHRDPPKEKVINPHTLMTNKTDRTAETPKEIEISLKLHRYISGKLVEYLGRYKPNHAIKASVSNAYFDGYAEGYLDAESHLNTIAGEVADILIDSLGECVEGNEYRIRPTKVQFWIEHMGVGSGEPLRQWIEREVLKIINRETT